jgi:hypothetical protein
MIAAVGVALIGILVVAPSAPGQAAIDQYLPSADPSGQHANQSDPGTPLPGGQAPKVGSSGGPGSSLGPQGAGLPNLATARDSGSAAGGHVPGTDYPVTPFVIVIAAAVAIGALARFGPKLIRR